MNDLDVLISERRDTLCEWVCDRFRYLIAEDRMDDALYFADEWFEWMDPENHEQEETIFIDERTLIAHYDELTQGSDVWWPAQRTTRLNSLVFQGIF